jgi:hypothetical protein
MKRNWKDILLINEATIDFDNDGVTTLLIKKAIESIDNT